MGSFDFREMMIILLKFQLSVARDKTFSAPKLRFSDRLSSTCLKMMYFAQPPSS